MGFRSDEEAARQRILTLERELESEREHGRLLEERLVAALCETPDLEVGHQPAPERDDALKPCDPADVVVWRKALIDEVLRRPRVSWRAQVDHDAEVAEAREVMEMWEASGVTSGHELVGLVAAQLGRLPEPELEPPTALAAPDIAPMPCRARTSRWNRTWEVLKEAWNTPSGAAFRTPALRPPRTEYTAAAERLRKFVKLALLAALVAGALVIYALERS